MAEPCPTTSRSDRPDGADRTVVVNVVGDRRGIQACAPKQWVQRRTTDLSVLELPRRGGGG